MARSWRAPTLISGLEGSTEEGRIGHVCGCHRGLRAPKVIAPRIGNGPGIPPDRLCDDLTDSGDLCRKMMRQAAGAFAEYEKGRLVGKLRSGRVRKRTEAGKKSGRRKSHAELWPEVVAKARRLRREKGKTGCVSYP